MGRKLGAAVHPVFGRGSWVPIKHSVTAAEIYLYAKFHLDPSNRVATIHQRYRQTDRTDRQNRTDRQRSDGTGEPFYKRWPKNGSPYAIGPLSVCLSCLSVTLVYCGQTVGWIKMTLRTEVGMGPGHTVFDGDPAILPKGHSPHFRPISAVAKSLDGSRCHLVGRYALAQTTLC